MIKVNWSILGILIPMLVVFYILFNTTYWREGKIIESDVISYYTYLPAIFIHQDPSLKYSDKLGDEIKSKVWYERVGNEGRVIKTTMGVSFFYFPFFILAHHYCLNSEQYTANGYSSPYKLGITLSSVFCLFFALVFLRRLLLKYFSELTVFFVLVSISIGTNLLNYVTREPGMSHCYSFFVISLFLYFADKWISNPRKKTLLTISAVLGIIVLIRPTNGIVVLFLLLFKINSLDSLKERLSNLLGDWKSLLLNILVFLLTLFPQMLYWKYNSGNWLLFSYTDNEHFFFNDPMIIKGLFSYRKGWLLYTPIMVFSIIGFLFKSNHLKDSKLSTSIILVLHAYIAFSWWAWWYGGSFGLRAMIDIYPVLAIPFAIFIEYLISKKLYIKLLPLTLVVALVCLNLYQSYQYREGLIHYQGMTKKTYWGVFLKETYPKGYWEDLSIPDYDAAKKGKRDI